MKHAYLCYKAKAPKNQKLKIETRTIIFQTKIEFFFLIEFAVVVSQVAITFENRDYAFSMNSKLTSIKTKNVSFNKEETNVS